MPGQPGDPGRTAQDNRLFVDAQGHLVCMKLSPGQDGDCPHGRDLLAEFDRGQIEHMLADTAYDGAETRQMVKQRKAKACIIL